MRFVCRNPKAQERLPMREGRTLLRASVATRTAQLQRPQPSSVENAPAMRPPTRAACDEGAGLARLLRGMEGLGRHCGLAHRASLAQIDAHGDDDHRHAAALQAFLNHERSLVVEDAIPERVFLED